MSVQKYVQVHEHAILQICPKTHCIGKTTQNEIQGCTALLHTDALGDVSVPQKAVTHTTVHTLPIHTQTGPKRTLNFPHQSSQSTAAHKLNDD